MTLCRETIPSLLDRAVLRFGMCCAVETTQERYSWREIGLLSDAAAESLAGRGIGRGDHVGIWGGNSLDWILAFLAVVKLGAVAALINNHYTERELSEVLRTGRVDWLLFGDCPELEHRPDLPVYAMRAVGAGARRAVDMRTEPAVRRRRCTEGRFRPAQLAGNCCEVCCLLFTSGSTKQPKCVMMTHYSMVNNAFSMAETLGIRMENTVAIGDNENDFELLQAAAFSAAPADAAPAVRARVNRVLCCCMDGALGMLIDELIERCEAG